MRNFRILAFFVLALNLLWPNQANSASMPSEIKIVSIFLTPIESPNFWKVDLKLENTKHEIQIAMNSWKKILNLTNVKIEYFSTKSLSNLAHCSYKSDWATATNEYKKEYKINGKYFLVFNPLDRCENAGYAQLNGKFASIKKISSTTIAHEFGHNLGFQHSASINCLKDELTKMPNNCEVFQYGDKTDVMGSGIVFDQAKMSHAQLALVFGKPKAKDLKPGTYWISDGKKLGDVVLGRIRLTDGYAYVEYDNATQNGGNRVGSDEKPGLQIRLVSNSVAKKYSSSMESGIGTLLLSRMKGFDEYNVCQGICYLDSRFLPGEQIPMPFSKYLIKVINVKGDGVQIQVLGGIK